MKNIEEYIIKNREKFNTKEPSPGHFAKFERKLQGKRKIRVLEHVAPALKIAAVFALVAMSSLWIIDSFFAENQPGQGISLSQVSPEMREVEYYYTSLINEKFAELQSLDLNSDKIQNDILMQELDEMNSVYESLKLELESNPSNEKIINAMIQYYQLKAEVMNQIIVQLKELEITTTLKSENNETNEI